MTATVTFALREWIAGSEFRKNALATPRLAVDKSCGGRTEIRGDVCS
jgi:hypothetical protein